MLFFAASIGTLSGAAFISYEWWKQLHDDLNSQTISWMGMFGHVPVCLGLLSAYITGLYTIFHA